MVKGLACAQQVEPPEYKIQFRNQNCENGDICGRGAGIYGPKGEERETPGHLENVCPPYIFRTIPLIKIMFKKKNMDSHFSQVFF